MTSPTTHIDTTSIVIVLPTIPPSPDYTPASDMESDPSEDPSSGHIPPLPATSPFLSSTNDSSDSDIPDIPQSPTHGTPFTKTTLSTQRKRVGPLPTHSLAVRHSVDYSSSDHFSLDDSSSSSSLETSSDSPVDVLSNSASSRSSSDHSLPASPSALSSTRTDLLPSPKRIRSPELATDLEGCSEDSFESYVPREARLRVDVGILLTKLDSTKSSHGSTTFDQHTKVYRSTLIPNRLDIDPEIQAEIDKYVSYADALRARGIDARVVVEAVVERRLRPEGAVEVTYEALGDLVQRFHDHTVAILVHHVQAIENEEVSGDGGNGNGGNGNEGNGNGVNGNGVNGNGVNGNGGNGNGGNGNGENGNGGNGNRGNGNSNGNGGGYGYNFGGYMLSRECTYQDCLKCHPLNFNGTEGVVGNSYKRTIGIEAAYAMSWAELMKLMT
ncbi:hypothetical protein Tco_1345678 [Tanacetum coccineum]